MASTPSYIRFCRVIWPRICQLIVDEGIDTYTSMARRLNDEQTPTYLATEWNGRAVSKVVRHMVPPWRAHQLFHGVSSPTVRAAIALKLFGRPRPEEVKRKISETMSRR